MRLSRHFTSQIVTILMICFLVGVGVLRDIVINANADTDRRPTVILDAGHGGLTNTTH